MDRAADTESDILFRRILCAYRSRTSLRLTDVYVNCVNLPLVAENRQRESLIRLGININNYHFSNCDAEPYLIVDALISGSVLVIVQSSLIPVL